MYLASIQLFRQKCEFILLSSMKIRERIQQKLLRFEYQHIKNTLFSIFTMGSIHKCITQVTCLGIFTHLWFDFFLLPLHKYSLIAVYHHSAYFLPPTHGIAGSRTRNRLGALHWNSLFPLLGCYQYCSFPHQVMCSVSIFFDAFTHLRCHKD